MSISNLFYWIKTGKSCLIEEDLEAKKLEASADLYAEIYQEDKEISDLTESALIQWPE